MKSSRPTSYNTFLISSSLKLFEGSTFSLKVPSINVGSCGIIVKFCLNISNPILLISMSSINIFPLSASNNLNKHRHSVDFPLPVRPTTPIFSFGFISKFKFFKTNGVFGLYLTL